MIDKRFAVRAYCKQLTKSFQDFMDLTCLPNYTFETKRMNVDAATGAGWGAFVEHYYDCATNTHKIRVWEDIDNPVLNANYLVFHELTHLVDYDCFVHGDKNRSLMIRSYSEYHAGQIDLTKLLGKTTVNSIPDFFMSDQIEGIGGRKSVNEYVGQSLQLVVDLLQRPDFPANPETLMTVLSSANNYWGRKSICELSQTG